jgi:hypothetical protein
MTDIDEYKGMSDAVAADDDHYLSYARGKYLAAYTLKELGNIVDVAWVMARDNRLTIIERNIATITLFEVQKEVQHRLNASSYTS